MVAILPGKVAINKFALIKKAVFSKSVPQQVGVIDERTLIFMEIFIKFF